LRTEYLENGNSRSRQTRTGRRETWPESRGSAIDKWNGLKRGQGAVPSRLSWHYGMSLVTAALCASHTEIGRQMMTGVLILS